MPNIFDIKTKNFFPLQFSFADYQKLKDPLSGLFAFIAYNLNNNQPILIVNPLKTYDSNHSGIHMVVKERYKQKPHALFPPTLEPLYGGEILFLEGEIIFWNCKSDCFSRKTAYADSEITEARRKETGLPRECFVYAMKSQEFSQTPLMRELFNEDGSYRTNIGKGTQNPTPEQIAAKVKTILGLDTPRLPYHPPSPSTTTLCFSAAGTAAG